MRGFFVGAASITTFATMTLSLFKIFRRMHDQAPDADFKFALGEEEDWKPYKSMKTMAVTWFYGKNIDKESCQDGRTRHSQLFHQLDPLLCVCYDISHRWLRNFWQRSVFHPWNIRQGQPHVQPAALHACLQTVRKGKRMRWSACYEYKCFMIPIELNVNE